jgi:ADP-ribosylglycohydrolase
MIGAIAGDMIGARFERYPIKHTDFHFIPSTATFTDDTVPTIAVAEAILKSTGVATSLKQFAQKYHSLPYGGSFRTRMWSRDDKPYNSWGNGAAMRVSPVGFAYETIDDVLEYAQKSAEVTHNHPEGIKGAQSLALSIFLARKGESKQTDTC